MKVFELNIKCYLLNDIKQQDALSQIGFCIDLTLGKNEKFLEVHNKNSFKNYSFNSFYPLEQDKVYKEDYIYTFQLRTIDEELAIYLSEQLPKSYTKCIKILRIDSKIISKKHIDRIYSITPAVMKNDFGYWNGNMSFDQYAERIKINLIKKYNHFTNEKVDESFPLFTDIEIKNKKPIAINYKGKRILGDKISLNIADDDLSQKIAYMALGTGVLELNARGAGYLNYRWL